MTHIPPKQAKRTASEIRRRLASLMSRDTRLPLMQVQNNIADATEFNVIATDGVYKVKVTRFRDS